MVTTHQCIEDIALMRAVPGMVVLSSADEVETYAMLKEVINYDGPVYVRLGRYPVPQIFEKESYHFELGKYGCRGIRSC